MLMMMIVRLARDDSGATAIEYGLIAALIAVAAIAAFQLVGTNLSSVFSNIATQLWRRVRLPLPSALGGYSRASVSARTFRRTTPFSMRAHDTILTA
jgi:pilus assembly protein Flp/PilA